jgi:electron transfer flavoprotein alpha subunit
MILGLLDHDQGRLSDLSLEMLTFGRGLAAQMGLPLEAVLISAEPEPLADRLAAYGVARLHVAEHADLGEYAPEAWAAGLLAMMRGLRPAVVLAAGSDRGNEIMAHLAAQAGLPFAANCTAARPGERFEVTRVRWGGSLLEEAALHGAVKLLSVAAHAVAAEPAPASSAPGVMRHAPDLPAKRFRARVTSRIPADRSKVALAEARVVVGGGRGVGGAQGFEKLETLARRLGGAVGCSRAVTSLGWRPHLDQVGQTGTRIAPELYIACGISGAIQHMVGCRSAKHILAINIDPEAPIVAQAEYAVIGDLHEVVAAVNAALDQRSA